ncbi:hypothetical protein HJD18_14190 [Thermoleophilia bacterium SCSIO 60948]|nr:hypothetical protein HJD18_14190 [Thermoleophilia bacterium SCSIO 60948]
MSRRTRRPFAAALCLALLALTGCDPSNAEDDRVRDAIRSTLASLESGDAADFCARLADAEAEERFAEEHGGPCDEDTVSELLAEHTPEQRAALLDPQIAVIKIDEDTAGSTVNGDYLSMREVDGEWGLASYETPATRESIREDAGLEP